MFTALQIEWCKARAHAHRWDKEVTLTLMEMECTLLFFAAKQEQWEQCASWIDIEPGERAYALRQADIRRRIRNHAEQMWSPVTRWNATGEVPKVVRGRHPKNGAILVNGSADVPVDDSAVDSAI